MIFLKNKKILLISKNKDYICTIKITIKIDNYEQHFGEEKLL